MQKIYHHGAENDKLVVFHVDVWKGPKVLWHREGDVLTLTTSEPNGRLQVNWRTTWIMIRRDSFKSPSWAFALALTSCVVCFNPFEHKHEDGVVWNHSSTTQNVPEWDQIHRQNLHIDLLQDCLIKQFAKARRSWRGFQPLEAEWCSGKGRPACMHEKTPSNHIIL